MFCAPFCLPRIGVWFCFWQCRSWITKRPASVGFEIGVGKGEAFPPPVIVDCSYLFQVPPRTPFPELSEHIRRMEIARRQSELVRFHLQPELLASRGFGLRQAFESDLCSASDAEFAQANKNIGTIVDAADARWFSCESKFGRHATS